MTELLHAVQIYLWSLGFIIFAAFMGLLVHFVVFKALQNYAAKGQSRVRQSLPGHLKAPLRLLMPILVIRLSLPAHSINLHSETLVYLGLILSTLVIVSVAWLLVRLTKVLEDWLLTQYDIRASDNLAARKVVTQMDIVRKLLIFVIVVFSLAAILMNFDNFRQIGTSLLASAGIAGLVIGFAAQRTLGNVLAGLQIALTQPIRIDDVVIVENEWGRIEEITLTYVVVAIWDMRRLILPISYFIEHPFQNWTRTTAAILGTVFLRVDYSVPIDAIRQYLGEILQESSFWDGQVWRLHTTDTGERTVELRALMSAANSSDAWELRCEIREKLVTFVQQNYPDALPRFRAEITTSPAETASETGAV